MEEEDDCPKCKRGLPAWLATFGDLMTLLMCFFVLLLSFSEMDALKFKRLAGSMRNAFGIQNQIDVSAAPKGTSIIAQEFSPGRPEPTPINEIRQETEDDIRDSLEVLCQDEVTQQEESQGDTGKNSREVAMQQNAEMQAQKDASDFASQLAEAIEDGMLQVESVSDTIIIRISEQSFSGGSDYIEDDFLPVLDLIRDLLGTVSGSISVEGHTDNIPTTGGSFRNNFRLSVGRSMAVAEYLFIAPEMDASRFTIVGHGSTKPVSDNDSIEGRSQNRRVEIMVKKRNPEFVDIPIDEQGEQIEFGDRSLFNLSPDEIF